uniref:C2H2-type domain-containing protein n=1 Tax=Timema shepardi TaxID=629360 RepID=A0A7R9AYX2_TIMSH|nr:unnamed protein product [Timema shepardi]
MFYQTSRSVSNPTPLVHQFNLYKNTWVRWAETQFQSCIQRLTSFVSVQIVQQPRRYRGHDDGAVRLTGQTEKLNEPDYYTTEIKLENTYESIVQSSINLDKTSNAPASDVCEDLGFKEELCVGESSLYIRKNNIMGFGQNMTNKKLGFQGNDDELKEAIFLSTDPKIYQNDEKKYNCDVYNNCFTEKGNFTIHLPTNNGQILHTCDICGKCFNMRRNLRLHLLLHSEHKQYRCDVCGKCFKRKDGLRIHISTHSEQNSHTCDVCGKCFNMRRYLKSHLLFHSEHRQYRCDVCGKCFKRKHGLRIHITTHSEQKPHTCNVCGKVLESKEVLKPHLLTHNGQKFYKCDVCGRCFSKAFNLKTHLLSHNIQKPKCHICGMYFKKNSQLKTHLLRHSNQRPHKCDVCGRCFRWKGNYNIHLLIHSGHKPHKCDVCGKRFKRKYVLRAHILTHSGQKPHKCYICGKDFKSIKFLKPHLLTHSGQKPYICDYCGESFTAKASVQRHIIRKHVSSHQMADRIYIFKDLDEIAIKRRNDAISVVDTSGNANVDSLESDKDVPEVNDVNRDVESDDVESECEDEFPRLKGIQSLREEDFDFNDVYVDMVSFSRRRITAPTKLVKSTLVDDVLKKSVITPGFEKLHTIPLPEENKKKLKKIRQVGRVVEAPADYYHSRVPMKQRKKTIVEELMADAEFQKYNKKRYKEIIEQRRKTHFKAHKQAKKLKRKKK